MLLIKQAQIVDGSGAKPFKGDILINKGKISAIGNVIKKKGARVIDGLGLIATPGFIDANTDSDHYLSLFTNPKQEDFIKQGVSTIIGGQCGFSLAPLMYGSLASLKEWTDGADVNVDWSSVKELFNILYRIKLGIRFETLVGYSTIKQDLIGRDFRDLTISEINIFEKIIERAFKDGALGMSVTFGNIFGGSATLGEVKRLAKIILKYEKICAFHLGDVKRPIAVIMEEVLNFIKKTGIKSIISHFRPIRGMESDFEKSLNLLDKNLGQADVYFDVNPFEITLTPIYAFLPSWMQNLSTVEALVRLRDNKIKERITLEIAGQDLNDLVIVNSPGQDFLNGKSLEKLAQSRGKNLIEMLITLMEETNFRMMFSSKNLNGNMLTSTLFHPRSLIGSNSASFLESNKTIKLERATSTFTKFLEIAFNKNILIEEAVKKITSFPAKIFGLKNRGILKDGYIADIVLLKENQQVVDLILNGEQIFNAKN